MNDSTNMDPGDNILLTELDEDLHNYDMFEKYSRTMLVTLRLILQSRQYRETSDSIYVMFVTMSVVIAGWIYSKYVLILVSNIIIAGANSENKFHEMSTEIKAFCDAGKVPKELEVKIETYFKLRFNQHYFNEKAIRNSTSSSLSKEIMMHSCANLVSKVPLFKEIPQLLLENIISSLKLEIYFPGDVIIRADDSTSDSMFFIAFGTAAIHSASGEIFRHISDISHEIFQ